MSSEMAGENKKKLQVVAALILHPERREILAFRRRAGDSGAGLLEFPGGKIEQGESNEQAIEREMLEELGVKVQVQKQVAVHTHQYPSREIEIHLYHVMPLSWDLQLSEHSAMLWLSANQLDREDWLAGDLAFLPMVKTILAQSAAGN